MIRLGWGNILQIELCIIRYTEIKYDDVAYGRPLMLQLLSV